MSGVEDGNRNCKLKNRQKSIRYEKKGKLALAFSLPLLLFPHSQRMDPYLSVLNYACHNSIMKQRKDGHLWN